MHAAPLPGPAGLRELGHLGALPCWFVVGQPSEIRSTARRLARHGTLGLLLGSQPKGEQLQLCVTIAPVRAVTIGALATESLPLTRLSRVAPTDSLLGTAMACAAALDIDAAGRRAFGAMRTAIVGAVDHVPAIVPRAVAHGWVLLQVTRLLFLRFVESEGWLDGRSTFLMEQFDRCLTRRGHPEPCMLAPLFFGTLNRPPTLRSVRAAAFGAVPFLNGGLFEPHPVERRRAWSLPVSAWQELFALVVESFEVTLDRGETGDRVSPELLGRVLEGMMAPAERKAAGTFYTPTELVPAILRATLCSHLAARLGRSEEQVARDLDDRDPALDQALLSLRILDPAVGSGAFLVGALALICDHAHHTAPRVRHVITRQLFGVDRNPAAVRLCELRLWLELLRAMRGRTASRVAPLPNLDTSIRAGDALCDPFAGARLPDTLARRLGAARRAVTRSHGAPRRAAISTLRRVEQRAATAALGARAHTIRTTIADLADQAHTSDLFGTRGALRHDTELRILALRKELRQVRRDRQRLRLDGAAPAFGIESAFAPVLARGGFDLVVGNPPWIRGDRLPAREQAALSLRYRWWRGGGAGWRQLPDLAVAFLERGLELLAANGTMGMLVPAKLATAGYATRCRAALVEHSTLHVVADLERDPRASFEATTYPLALVASKRRAPGAHRVCLDLDDRNCIRQEAWREVPTWSLSPAPLQHLARRLARLPMLRDSCVASLGVKTGANRAFLNPSPALHEFCRPAIRGRDVRAFSAIPSAFLLWPADACGVPWVTLPEPVEQHLTPFRALLERRADMQAGPWWQMFRVSAATAQWRVTWSDLAPSLRAAALIDAAPVPLNSCYVAALPSEQAMLACTAWLNSTAIGALVRSIAEPAANGYARFGARVVGTAPLPVGVLNDPELAALGTATWCPEVRDAIDRLVARWLELSTKESGLVRALVPHRG